MNNIRSLNIFKSVKSEILDGSVPNTKIVNVTVEEKPTGEISLGAGVSSDGGTMGFSVGENNFMGKGIGLSTSLRLSGDTVRGNFTVLNPNFNYTGRSLSTNIESTKIDKMTSSGYESSKNGFSFGTRFEQYENVFFSPSISTYWESIETNSTASDSLRKQKYLSHLLVVENDPALILLEVADVVSAARVLPNMRHKSHQLVPEKNIKSLGMRLPIE